MKNKIISQTLFLLFILLNISAIGQENKSILIDVQYNFPENANTIFKAKVDSIFSSMKSQFNQESKHLKFSLNTEEVPYVLEVNLSKVKLVSNRGRKSAYWINGIGLTIVPVASLAMGITAPIMITCFPQNNIKSSLILPKEFSDSKKKLNIKLCTGSLFISNDKMINKLSKKFVDKIYKELKKLDEKHTG